MQSPPAFHEAVAHFIDHRSEGVFGTFGDHDMCPEELLLWLFLSDPGAAPLEETDRRDPRAVFYALPTVLRDMLGPDLARAFVKGRAGRGAALEVRAALAPWGSPVCRKSMAFLDLDLPGTPPPSEKQRVTPANAGTTRADPALSHRLMTRIRTDGALPSLRISWQPMRWCWKPIRR